MLLYTFNFLPLFGTLYLFLQTITIFKWWLIFYENHINIITLRIILQIFFGYVCVLHYYFVTLRRETPDFVLFPRWYWCPEGQKDVPDRYTDHTRRSVVPPVSHQLEDLVPPTEGHPSSSSTVRGTSDPDIVHMTNKTT